MRAFGLAEPEVEPALPAGCRVRVKSGDVRGVGVVKTPVIANAPYSRIEIEFDDEPGTWWAFDREHVSAA